ncbi:hypothetical protein E2C01_092077 [Portunus trituberculatus]|uniref:Uncharacterized protein n=1 Tax=Portunus trituberculatus TaxID=210409 RepID=A0A5B7JPN3_PORTR|nr:hypothetical protein [Portunus trituberculatus]
MRRRISAIFSRGTRDFSGDTEKDTAKKTSKAQSREIKERCIRDERSERLPGAGDGEDQSGVLKEHGRKTAGGERSVRLSLLEERLFRNTEAI